MENSLKVRECLIEDAQRLLEIYGYYVKNTAITFEYEVPSLEEFKMRMENISRKYPYFVILKNGRIEGFAYAAPFMDRKAYEWSCTLTVYIDINSQKCGMGKMLYEALENRLFEMGITNLYACIAYPEKEDEYLTKNSADFHSHIGFKKVGEFYRCGCKFGRWYNMIYMEKIIGKHKSNPLSPNFTKP